MSEFREGDVVRYIPDDRPGDKWWRREGMAIVTAVEPYVRILDTYWSSMSDSHVLTETEAMSAELVFNRNDYDVVQQRLHWAEYAPEDRAFIQSQHNLQHVWLVRKGAEPSQGQKIRNAQEKVDEAIAAVASASRSLEWAKRDLDKLIEEALVETDERLAVGDRAVPA